MQIKDKKAAYLIPIDMEVQTSTVETVRYELMDYSLIKKYFPTLYKDIKKKRKLKD